MKGLGSCFIAPAVRERYVYSFHDTVANVGLADGSVRTLHTSTSLWTIGAMTTRAG